MHARGSGEAARRAKPDRQPLPFRAISHARGHLRVLRFARRTTEKRETARSLVLAWLPVVWHLDKDKQGALGLFITDEQLPK